MSLTKISNATTSRVIAAIDQDMPAAKQDEIARIIDAGVIDAAVSTRQQCTSVIRHQIGPDADTAHKIEDQMRRSEQALIENLKAMR